MALEALTTLLSRMLHKDRSSGRKISDLSLEELRDRYGKKRSSEPPTYNDLLYFYNTRFRDGRAPKFNGKNHNDIELARAIKSHFSELVYRVQEEAKEKNSPQKEYVDKFIRKYIQSSTGNIEDKARSAVTYLLTGNEEHLRKFVESPRVSRESYAGFVPEIQLSREEDLLSMVVQHAKQLPYAKEYHLDSISEETFVSNAKKYLCRTLKKDNRSYMKHLVPEADSENDRELDINETVRAMFKYATTFKSKRIGSDGKNIIVSPKKDLTDDEVNATYVPVRFGYREAINTKGGTRYNPPVQAAQVYLIKAEGIAILAEAAEKRIFPYHKKTVQANGTR